MKAEKRTKVARKRLTRSGIKACPVVIVVHSDPVQLSNISLLAGKEAAEVHSFPGADEALQFMVKNGPPRLIVTEPQISGSDGRRFCGMVRSPEYSALNHVPILVVSAIAAKDAHSITSGPGPNGFSGIPYKAADFRAKVHDLLQDRPPASAPGFILLDGDAVFSKSLEKAIHARGFEVRTATSRAGLWRLFFKHRPVGIVIDSVLAAEGDGALIAEIKRRDPLCAVIIVSEQTSGEAAIQWIEAGANAYIGKQSPAKEILGVCESASHERMLPGIRDQPQARHNEMESDGTLYRAAFEAAGEAMLVFEEQSGRIVEANEAATNLYRSTRTELRTMRFGELAAAEIETFHKPDTGGKLTRAWHRRKNGGGFAAEIVVRPFAAESGRLNVAVVRDLSDRMVGNREKEPVTAHSEGNPKKNQVLRGLLHICANCKKIKDDKGYWKALESYLSRLSGTRVSHGICPDCVKKLYPDHGK